MISAFTISLRRNRADGALVVPPSSSSSASG